MVDEIADAVASILKSIARQWRAGRKLVFRRGSSSRTRRGDYLHSSGRLPSDEVAALHNRAKLISTLLRLGSIAGTP